MRRFRFRLQSILDLRRYEEDQRRLELGGITARCERLRRDIAETDRLRHETLTTLPYGVSGADITWRIAQAEYADSLVHKRTHLEQELSVCENEWETAAERYRSAKRNADVLARLRERREEHHIREEKRRSHIALDEIGQTMHRRATGEGGIHAV